MFVFIGVVYAYKGAVKGHLVKKGAVKMKRLKNTVLEEILDAI